jgi:hypothetical protein
MATPIEHRWGHRVAVELEVRLLNGTQLIGTGRIVNASVSGAFIETSDPVPQFANLVLQPISADGDTDDTMRIPACVLRVDRGGVGVEWRDMACPAVISIVTHAARRAPLPATENHRSAGS